MNGLEFSMSLASSNLIDYFVDSNTAGKIVIVFLGVMNCYALSLMWAKYQDLKRAIRNNARDEKRINDLSSIYDYDDALFSGEGSPYLAICSRAGSCSRTKAVGQVRMTTRECHKACTCRSR